MRDVPAGPSLGLSISSPRRPAARLPRRRFRTTRSSPRSSGTPGGIPRRLGARDFSTRSIRPGLALEGTRHRVGSLGRLADSRDGASRFLGRLGRRWCRSRRGPGRPPVPPAGVRRRGKSGQRIPVMPLPSWRSACSRTIPCKGDSSRRSLDDRAELNRNAKKRGCFGRCETCGERGACRHGRRLGWLRL